ncbi:DJ-1/PfpI family protein [Dyadobacter jejuensis]|nr:DJ-1/PfpI family protein [Dyadobacter jejuensis]
MENTTNLFHVAILVADGFEQLELSCPLDSLTKAGAQVKVISPNKDWVRSWHQVDWGKDQAVDVPLPMARPEFYQALLVPGGMMSIASLRTNATAIDFVRHFLTAGKPVGVIGCGAQLLINAGVTPGRRLTSCKEVRVDLENAGAQWIDQSIVTDKGLVSCGTTDHLSGFIKKMILEFNLAVPVEVN